MIFAEDLDNYSNFMQQSVSANSFHLHKSRIMSASLALPDHFEVIVVGTDVTESIVAAAAARLGHSVLHLDTAGYYGGDSASFTLEGLTKWIDQQNEEICNKAETEADLTLEEGEELVSLGTYKTVISPQYTWHERTKEEENKDEGSEKETTDDAKATDSSDLQGKNEEQASDLQSKEQQDTPGKVDQKNEKKKKIWNKDELMVESRRFNLDLNPRLLYARGGMVELLISSNISRYTEFKSVTRVLTKIGGRLEHVPSSRSDVFGTKHITVVEKRILMKFLSYCVNEKIEDILRGRENKSFTEFLCDENLTENLIHFVMHSIAMVAPGTPVRQGLQATVKFLSSLGRFGSTPFLWSMYGTGELPQAFCRLCAVFGGVYYLGRKLSGIIVKEDKCVGILTEGKRINCDYLVLPDNLLPDKILTENLTEVTTDRGIYVSENSILAAEKEQITLLSLPTKYEPLHVIEVGPGTAACPKGLQVVHATCQHNEEDSLKQVEQVLPDQSTIISFTFQQKTRKGEVTTKLSNTYRASGPVPELDFEFCVEEAKKIYCMLYPQEEFLPRAPDPEEIIIGDDEKEGSEENDKDANAEKTATSQEVGKDDDDEPVQDNSQESSETQQKTSEVGHDSSLESSGGSQETDQDPAVRKEVSGDSTDKSEDSGVDSAALNQEVENTEADKYTSDATEDKSVANNL